MTPSVKQIRYICAVADYRHFSKAAEACFVTQSTLSAAIQDLESQLGVVIFERSKRSVLITPSGEKLLDQARKILGEIEDFVSLAKTSQDLLTGDIRLGVIPTIGPFMLPDLLKELRDVIKDNNIFAIIVGNPINMDGSYGKSAQSTNDKAKIIERELNMMVAMWDERLSTSGAVSYTHLTLPTILRV